MFFNIIDLNKSALYLRQINKIKLKKNNWNRWKNYL